MAKQKIDWEAWNRARQFFEKSSIMNGEEKQLSDDEIAILNENLQGVNTLIGHMIPVLNDAKERFRNR